MTETNNTNETTPAAPAKRRRTGWLVAGATAAIVATGAIAANAFGGGPHWGHHGGFGGPGMMMGLMDATPEDRADRAIRHLAVEVDATADQQEKLRAIAKGLVKDLVPLREKVQAARKTGRDFIGAATVDKAAIEKFRAEQVAQMDATSKRVTQALTEALDVLTPEQRKKLDERLPRGDGFGPRWRRG